MEISRTIVVLSRVLINPVLLLNRVGACSFKGVWGYVLGGGSSNTHTLLMLYISFIGTLWWNNQIDYLLLQSVYTLDNAFM